MLSFVAEGLSGRSIKYIARDKHFILGVNRTITVVHVLSNSTYTYSVRCRWCTLALSMQFYTAVSNFRNCEYYFLTIAQIFFLLLWHFGWLVNIPIFKFSFYARYTVKKHNTFTNEKSKKFFRNLPLNYKYWSFKKYLRLYLVLIVIVASYE